MSGSRAVLRCVSFDLRFAHLPGGSWPYVSNVVPILIREHPEITWRLYHNPWSPPQQEILRLLQTEFGPSPDHNIELRPIRAGCLSLRHHLEFLSCRDDADLYHYPHFDLPLGLRRLPLVITIHDLYPLTVPDYCSSLKRRYFYHLTKRNLRRVHRIIAISQYTHKGILENFDIPPEKITIINQGRSASHHPIDDTELLQQIKLKYHLPDQFILYTGNHKPHKNLHRLFQAYANLPTDTRQTFPLILTGPLTADTEQLRTAAQSLAITDSVTFLGAVDADDLPALYNLASLCVLPSLYEGFGVTPLEAMACGTPAVCSNTTAIPEVVGDVARSFDPYSIDEITAALTAALEKDVNNPQLRQSCLAQAEKYTWTKTARKTFDLYRSLADH